MAILIRRWLWPWIAGPQVQTKSISSRSSAVMSVAPRAAFTKNGAPPTERKARTGEVTPPGMSCRARAKRESEMLFNTEGAENTEVHRVLIPVPIQEHHLGIPGKGVEKYPTRWFRKACRNACALVHRRTGYDHCQVGWCVGLQ